MLPRFYVPDLDPQGREATIGEDEGRHLTRVMRLRAGDDVAIFDGKGHEFRARIQAASRHGVRVELLEPIAAAPEPRVALTLVQAVLKGDRMDDVVRDATMMGVSAVVPVMSAHLAVKASAIERSRPAERWRRVALASAKQCRRATLPSIDDVVPLREWLANPIEEVRFLFVEPSSGVEAHPLRGWMDRPAPANAAVIVGPEGGWAPEEIHAAISRGCTPVSLGGLTLRADAVAVAAISICRFVFGDV
jgi:16S rRNA (uracil1498-N3)-methyltransferase